MQAANHRAVHLPLLAKVGQTLSSVNPEIAVIAPQIG
jgi:hypothetical protein